MFCLGVFFVLGCFLFSSFGDLCVFFGRFRVMWAPQQHNLPFVVVVLVCFLLLGHHNTKQNQQKKGKTRQAGTYVL